MRLYNTLTKQVDVIPLFEVAVIDALPLDIALILPF